MIRYLVGLGVLSLSGWSWSEAADITVLTAEEQRVESACQRVAELSCSGPNPFPLLSAESVTPSKRQDAAKDRSDAAARAVELGTALWRRAQQTADGKTPDDRFLYWQRLRTLAEFKQSRQSQLAQSTGVSSARVDAAQVIAAFEAASRGFNDLSFRANADLRLLVTGFDPFNLHRDLSQSNPSGAAAMVLDGLVIQSGGTMVELQSALFPVRFADFDEGMVETLVDDHLLRAGVDGLITISMGRDGFDLERFPGRRRSAQAPDNLGVVTGASSSAPLIPRSIDAPLQGPEFVEFNLPVASLMSVQSPFPVRDNRRVRTLEKGWFAAGSLSELVAQTAVSGSGGGYLSNEISYRSVLRSQRASEPLIIGHIHTPRVTGFDAHTNHAIAEQITLMLTRSVPAMAQLRRFIQPLDQNGPPE